MAKDWSAHCWEGCDLWAWLRLLWANRFAVSPRLAYVAASVTGVSFCHFVLRHYQDILYADRIRRTPIRHDPVFILGHWRTGTTLLHEWLALDPELNAPNTYQCFEPNHFLLTESLVKRFLGFLLPERRPMDAMPIGWDRPQEDEFALCMMGQPSPYLKIAFPNRPGPTPGALDLDGLPPSARRRWGRALMNFARALTFRSPRRLVLKSPPHTARVPHLLRLFPGAKFIHIVRDPFDVFPSTVNLWKKMYTAHGLQVPNYDGLEEYVFSTLNHMYEKFEAARPAIPAGQFCEVRYEDLIASPLGVMAGVYDAVGLGDFGRLRPAIEAYLEQARGYKPNRHELDDGLRAKIAERWAGYFGRYGYARS